MANKFRKKILGMLILASIFSSTTSNVFAAYLESAPGNAVVNDASAIYFNPAALVILPNKQLVLREGIVSNYGAFTGTTIQKATRYTQYGTASTQTWYFLPQVFYGMPINNRITLGAGLLYPFYGISNYSPLSIIRYYSTYNYLSVLDLTPGMGVKLNEKLSVGIGADFEWADLTLNSMSGFPTRRIKDSLSSNKGNASGTGGHAGILYRPRLGTSLGLTYHSQVAFNLQGHSNFSSIPPVRVNNFKTNTVVTPASFVLSISQAVNKKLGFMGTIERMNWSSVRNLTLYNVASRVGTRAVIVPTTVIPFYLRDTWRLFLGAQYAATEKWKLNAGLTFDQDPVNPSYLIAPGNSIVTGIGAGYIINKQIGVDFTYAHTFYPGRHISINGRNNIINGNTQADRNSASGKLTWNFV